MSKTPQTDHRQSQTMRSWPLLLPSHCCIQVVVLCLQTSALQYFWVWDGTTSSYGSWLTLWRSEKNRELSRFFLTLDKEVENRYHTQKTRPRFRNQCSSLFEKPIEFRCIPQALPWRIKLKFNSWALLLSGANIGIDPVFVINDGRLVLHPLSASLRTWYRFLDCSIAVCVGGG